ncbi:MAG: ATP-binding protein [Candidatus Omnitrophota bacterium]
MEQKTEQTTQVDISVLNQAFRAFSETTLKFQEAHAKLEGRVTYLSKELAEKNSVLRRNVVKLERTQKYLNNILESISDGVVALNLEGNITTFNRAAQTITKFSPHEVINKHYSDLFSKWHKGKCDTHTIIYDITFSTGHETVIKNKSGEEVPIIAYSSLITDENSNVVGIVVTFNDLSKIKQLEDEIERAKRLSALGEMIAGVAHEIRNPLGGIEMFTSLLERECASDERKKRISQNIIQGVQSLNKIITEMLTFTQSFSKTEFQKVNLIDCIESSLGFSCHELRKKNINIVKSYNMAQSVLVMGDVDQLRQVFLNLLLNAGQAINCHDGAIQLTCFSHQRDGYGVVEITDNGCGIVPEDIEKIFDPFFTTKAKGTGLGLAVSYRIIEAHGGKIRVESKKGEGTSFIVYLPLVQEV